METPKPHPHAELIKAWADGITIQYRAHDSLWVDCDTMPNWDSDSEYRVKPEANKPWKPQSGGKYWFIGFDFTPENTIWMDDSFDKHCFKYGNCFQTKEEAEAAIPRVEAALKGTDVSANVGSNIGSAEIDGKPLTEQEIHLVRQYRDRVAENWKDAGLFWITGPEMDLITSLRLMRNNHGYPEQEGQ